MERLCFFVNILADTQELQFWLTGVRTIVAVVLWVCVMFLDILFARYKEDFADEEAFGRIHVADVRWEAEEETHSVQEKEIGSQSGVPDYGTGVFALDCKVVGLVHYAEDI
ncbi:hypothetical protein B0J11DRAFT_563420 [Dendryphion nanum]|uniref:Uncharacterized protein n=1 Tax=Dendryphion nanum TaxID=256645 RepID=A0A9P9EJZ4_9PLEO|nr:hypothetical protein B0J11DRAFT_563420 [Dendryphion nanum]